MFVPSYAVRRRCCVMSIKYQLSSLSPDPPPSKLLRELRKSHQVFKFCVYFLCGCDCERICRGGRGGGGQAGGACSSSSSSHAEITPQQVKSSSGVMTAGMEEERGEMEQKFKKKKKRAFCNMRQQQLQNVVMPPAWREHKVQAAFV